MNYITIIGILLLGFITGGIIHWIITGRWWNEGKENNDWVTKSDGAGDEMIIKSYNIKTNMVITTTIKDQPNDVDILWFKDVIVNR